MPSGHDVPHPSGNDRYALYALAGGRLRRLCETSRDGVGLALLSMLGLDPDGEPEGLAELERGDKFGLLDRRHRKWLVNPFL